MSIFIKGSKAMPENTVGIPITRPEKVDVPPKCPAYSFDEDTMMKKDTCHLNSLMRYIGYVV